MHLRTPLLLALLTAVLWVAPVARAADEPAKEKVNINSVISLFELVLDADADTAGNCLRILTEKIQTGEITPQQVEAIKPRLGESLKQILSGKADHPLYFDAAMLATTWKDSSGLAAVRKLFTSADVPEPKRIAALTALVAAKDPELLTAVGQALADSKGTSADFRGHALDTLGRLEDAQVAVVVLKQYDSMEPELKPKAIELLTQRAPWARELLSAIGAKRIPSNVLNTNQVRRLQASKDPELVQQVQSVWGTVRTDRNPQRAQVISEMRRLVRSGQGDPHKGQAIFKKLCGQCHKIYGEGQEVGPDITRNGRNSFEQLLSNVFDPSLVIGASYQARTIETDDGRILTGLVAEDSPQRVILKMQGGKLETVPKSKIEEMAISKLSMMPEDLEKQLKPEEIIDLFAFITLDKPPSDPTAQRLPGAREIVPRTTENAEQFDELISEVAVGFSTKAAGEGGVALLKEHFGRPGVLRTHPVSRETPCVLSMPVKVPAGKKTQLLLAVSHDKQGDWQLVVRANDDKLRELTVGPKTATENGWIETTIDLTPYAGQSIRLELENRANGWAWEFGYWGRVELLTE